MNLAGKRPTLANRSDRASRAAGVGILYGSRSRRIRPAIKSDSPPKWLLSGFRASPKGGRRPPTGLLQWSRNDRLRD